MVVVDKTHFIGKVFALLPHEAMIGGQKLAYYSFYRIFGKVFTPFYIVPVLYTILVIIMSLISIHTFRKYSEK